MDRKILITNDDGIMSDGLIRLAKAAAKYGDVWVVAPESQRSAASHSITLRTHIDLTKVDFPVEGVTAYACSGMPGDCVRIGVLNIVPGKPDFIFSGINYGYNCATDLQYSATAGAAFEGVFQGINSIAFSEDMSDMHETTDDYLDKTIEIALEKPYKPGYILNINFPGCRREECRGINENVTVSTDCFYKDSYTEEILDDKTVRYRVKGTLKPNGEPGSDLKSITDNYVTIGYVNNVGIIN